MATEVGVIVGQAGVVTITRFASRMGKAYQLTSDTTGYIQVTLADLKETVRMIEADEKPLRSNTL